MFLINSRSYLFWGTLYLHSLFSWWFEKEKSISAISFIHFNYPLHISPIHFHFSDCISQEICRGSLWVFPPLSFHLGSISQVAKCPLYPISTSSSWVNTLSSALSLSFQTNFTDSPRPWFKKNSSLYICVEVILHLRTENFLNSTIFNSIGIVLLQSSDQFRFFVK